MNYPTHDTDWALSAKGNYWRRINGTPLIVGKRKDGQWWARRGDDFIRGAFATQRAAMTAAEIGIDGSDRADGNDDRGPL